MQLGTENRNKTIAAIGLMVLAVVFAVARFYPDSPASAKSPTPVVDLPPGTRRTVIGKTTSGEKPALPGAARVRLIQPFVTTG